MRAERPLKIRRFAPIIGLILLALVLSLSSAPYQARAQEQMESDPGKCAAINLAHYYLICADINLELHAMLKKNLEKNAARASKVEREAVNITDEISKDFVQVTYNLYKFAGRELTADAMKARDKFNNPHVEAALVEYAQQVRQRIMGNREPPKPNMYNLCTRAALGAEIRDANKLNARLKEYLHEAEQLLQKQKSCLK